MSSYPKPATVGEYDEVTGAEKSGTQRSASTKHRPKHDRTSSSSKPHRQLVDDSPPASPGARAPTKHSRREAPDERSSRKHEHKKSASDGGKRRSSSVRPSSSRGNEASKSKSSKDDSIHYVVKTQAPPPLQVIPIRTRAPNQSRPISYSAVQYPGLHAYPPISHSGWYVPAPQVGVLPGSYPPPPSPYRAAPPQQDYFAPQPARPLADRFEHNRSNSAMSMRESSLRTSVQDRYEDVEPEYSVSRRVSIGRRPSIREPSRPPLNKAVTDSERMPPPPRPILKNRPATEYPRDPSPVAPVLLYSDPRRSYYDEPRRSLVRNSAVYDQGRNTHEYRIETANNGRRRESYYGQTASTNSSSTGSEDKYNNRMNAAKEYQNEVAGEALPLTAERLRQQRRLAGSTRSTKSSQSRDESDYRQSTTTKTTRSGGEDENLTIKVVGSAKLNIGNTHVEFGEGGEVHINRQPSLRSGSEMSSDYGERRRIDDRERRPRIEDSRSSRSRMSSTRRSSQSYIRERPRYVQDTDEYERNESNFF
ncbi:hypothetical protein BP6252_12939 [Coleophoma cylindrospora]|uniref:Uncharacterized protein n=1 Tax=Coleophoma cylindrospora TaxID=1849047 RepID=A0A3D8QDA9_9HELO|nr:hypothetical protein BP6252_12939 [Coleophoma cylindrospora]